MIVYYSTRFDKGDFESKDYCDHRDGYLNDNIDKACITFLSEYCETEDDYFLEHSMLEMNFFRDADHKDLIVTLAAWRTVSYAIKERKCK